DDLPRLLCALLQRQVHVRPPPARRRRVNQRHKLPPLDLQVVSHEHLVERAPENAVRLKDVTLLADPHALQLQDLLAALLRSLRPRDDLPELRPDLEVPDQFVSAIGPEPGVKRLEPPELPRRQAVDPIRAIEQRPPNSPVVLLVVQNAKRI